MEEGWLIVLVVGVGCLIVVVVSRKGEVDKMGTGANKRNGDKGLVRHGE